MNYSVKVYIVEDNAFMYIMITLKHFVNLLTLILGSFHLIRMMFDEYVFLVLETQHACANEQQRQASIQKLMKHRGEAYDSSESVIPSVIKLQFSRNLLYFSLILMNDSKLILSLKVHCKAHSQILAVILKYTVFL